MTAACLPRPPRTHHANFLQHWNQPKQKQKPEDRDFSKFIIVCVSHRAPSHSPAHMHMPETEQTGERPCKGDEWRTKQRADLLCLYEHHGRKGLRKKIRKTHAWTARSSCLFRGKARSHDSYLALLLQTRIPQLANKTSRSIVVPPRMHRSF